MTLKFHWFLPTYGDSRFIVGGGHGLPAGVARGDRRATIGYLSSIVRAAEEFGFVGVLTPTGAWCVITRDTSDEAWEQAHRLLEAFGPEAVEAAQAGLRRSESVGQQRMRGLHAASRGDRARVSGATAFLPAAAS